MRFSPLSMQSTKISVLFLIVTGFAACSTASVRILPGEDGVHRAVAKDQEREDAEEAALDKAKDFCEEKNQQFVIVKESSKYQGSMDEDARKTVRNASKAVTILGAGNAGSVGYAMTSDRDYEAEVVFKCK